MTTAIYSYNQGSASAKALAAALGIKRIKHEGSKFKDSVTNTIINWGSSNVPYNSCQIINHPTYIAIVTNKLAFFTAMGNSSWVVPHTTDISKVREWLSDGKIIVARTKLSGHSGEGIVLLEGSDAEIVEAPLYTLYVPKKHEYRVHVRRLEGLGDVIMDIFDVQQKKRKTDVADADVNWKIRNLDGGFIYAREDIVLPDCVKQCAIEVFSSSGLDFGAVDIIYNEQGNKAYALEINTAPGLTGTTLEKYAEAIGGLI
jgi:hypothetical protein